MYESLLNEQQTLTNYLVEMLAKYICVDEIERVNSVIINNTFKQIKINIDTYGHVQSML